MKCQQAARECCVRDVILLFFLLSFRKQHARARALFAIFICSPRSHYHQNNDTLDPHKFFFLFSAEDQARTKVTKCSLVPVFARRRAVKIIRCSSIRHWYRKDLPKRSPIVRAKAAFSRARVSLLDNVNRAIPYEKYRTNLLAIDIDKKKRKKEERKKFTE